MDITGKKDVAELTWPDDPTLIFSRQERAFCGRGTNISSLQHWAGRLAAKRAVVRVLDWGEKEPVTWTELEILPGLFGEPIVKLKGEGKEKLFRGESRDLQVSISHSQTLAVAVVVLGS